MNYPKCDLINTAVSPPAAVRVIDRSEMISKLSRHNDFVFVMAMDQPRFDTAHIEGSISFDQLDGRLRVAVPRSRDSDLLHRRGVRCKQAPSGFSSESGIHECLALCRWPG